MSRTKFTARFATGDVFVRTSDRKAYTHAWFMKWTLGPIPPEWPETAYTPAGPRQMYGFASSRELAVKALESAKAALKPAFRRDTALWLSDFERNYPRSINIDHTEIVEVK